MNGPLSAPDPTVQFNLIFNNLQQNSLRSKPKRLSLSIWIAWILFESMSVVIFKGLLCQRLSTFKQKKAKEKKNIK